MNDRLYCKYYDPNETEKQNFRVPVVIDKVELHVHVIVSLISEMLTRSRTERLIAKWQLNYLKMSLEAAAN